MKFSVSKADLHKLSEEGRDPLIRMCKLLYLTIKFDGKVHIRDTELTQEVDNLMDLVKELRDVPGLKNGSLERMLITGFKDSRELQTLL